MDRLTEGKIMTMLKKRKYYSPTDYGERTLSKFNMQGTSYSHEAMEKVLKPMVKKGKVKVIKKTVTRNKFTGFGKRKATKKHVDRIYYLPGKKEEAIKARRKQMM
ncbi:hypothetical protein KAH94_03750 [bacterium]|nr:hypothetical protein [bacterium]